MVRNPRAVFSKKFSLGKPNEAITEVRGSLVSSCPGFANSSTSGALAGRVRPMNWAALAPSRGATFNGGDHGGTEPWVADRPNFKSYYRQTRHFWEPDRIPGQLLKSNPLTW